MNSVFLLILLVIGVLFAAYANYNRHTDRLNSLQKRHDLKNPELEYEYNRFNTKKERTTFIKIENDKLILKTDIQNIRIINQTLVSKISSEYEDFPLIFDVVVQPFEKVLFELEGYTNFNQDGIIIMGSYGMHTKLTIEKIDQLRFLVEFIPEKPKATYLKLNSFKVDTMENLVILNGNFPDMNEFMVIIDYESFKLEVHAPVESIRTISNFNDFDKLNIV
ncbi:MAG: hypothetical protein KDC34_20700 [Saprospiraceae bacterium]|nr:hypothetical protein [Saprospiraceae bacterium]